MKKTILIFVQLILAYSMIAQVPMAFNYQGVARNSDFTPVSDSNISVLLNISQGSPDGTIFYQEEHLNIPTSPTGVFSFQVGKGQVTIGSMADIDWSSNQFFLSSFIDIGGGSDFIEMGSSELVSVPYALQAATAADDGDRDGTNELQNLSFDNNTGELSLSSGNTVTIPLSSGGDNWGSQTVRTDQTLNGSGTSSDPLVVNGDLTDDQTLSFSGNQLSIEGGNAVTIPDQTEDADADPNNELQSISRNGNEIILSNGGGSFKDEVEDEDADPDNELQTISRDGDEIILSDGGGSFFDEFEDADSDPDNELQILELDGNELSISDGNSVILPQSNSPWSTNSDGYPYVFNAGVGIGTDNPNHHLHIRNDNNTARLMVESSGVETTITSSEVINTGLAGTLSNHNFSLMADGEQHLTIHPRGNVGMGTTNPAERLHIRHNSKTAVLLEGPNVNTILGSNLVGYVGTTDNSDFALITDGTTRMTINQSGRIGINESTPINELHITEQTNVTTSPQLNLTNGNKFWTIGTNSLTGALRFTSSTSSLWYISEDGSPSSLMPEDDQLAFKSLSTEDKNISAIRTVSYSQNGATRYTLDKESVLQYFPEILTEEEIEMADGSTKTFSGYKYDQLIPVLINTINEQERQINEQNERIKALEDILSN